MKCSICNYDRESHLSLDEWLNISEEEAPPPYKHGWHYYCIEPSLRINAVTEARGAQP